MMKIQKFESLAQLEPLNLSKRFSSLQDSYNEPTKSPNEPRSPTSTDEQFVSDIEEQQEEEEEEDETGQKALELLHQTMDTFPSYNGLKPNSDKLLLDFFSEKITDGSLKSEKEWSFDEELLEEAEDWINRRKTQELFLEWNVHKNRQVYIRDMEKRREWKNLDEEHKEVVLELESEVFGALLDEILLDISAMCGGEGSLGGQELRLCTAEQVACTSEGSQHRKDGWRNYRRRSGSKKKPWDERRYLETSAAGKTRQPLRCPAMANKISRAEMLEEENDKLRRENLHLIQEVNELRAYILTFEGTHWLDRDRDIWLLRQEVNQAKAKMNRLEENGRLMRKNSHLNQGEAISFQDHVQLETLDTESSS
ncbi:hypothetical protein BUALT_Bualt10G0011600 [Buddleja alternifolia]|uniref:Uncharacterized protein n=1 Tax=Buddleja alternifolia TaxID=168488 RepID=A0AAV6WV71_9LAMI|nr:hypothetical protein BUALT_Bualt10G0011600 [Buddleja alternifolia]